MKQNYEHGILEIKKSAFLIIDKTTSVLAFDFTHNLEANKVPPYLHISTVCSVSVISILRKQSYVNTTRCQRTPNTPHIDRDKRNGDNKVMNCFRISLCKAQEIHVLFQYVRKYCFTFHFSSFLLHNT